MKLSFKKIAGVILVLSSILGVAGLMENIVSITIVECIYGILICTVLFGLGGLALIWDEDADIFNNL